ncbi:hypothetical protein LA20249_02745 [Companilactobacillus alimentarius DSM 20249]|uniref:Uncharacterized protein n=1 Tax=Companilactobacillus alimentarius DSM 20249 TaxID=1423720 RepID=A0A2K9HRW5_9LACO|nr:hypothetical protein LA20249_02745 [Companilactobacillus alimentarius DSM 20249]
MNKSDRIVYVVTKSSIIINFKEKL